MKKNNKIQQEIVKMIYLLNFSLLIKVFKTKIF